MRSLAKTYQRFKLWTGPGIAQHLGCLIVLGMGICGLLTLSGCAPISKADCLYGDWFEIGFDDGAIGETMGKFSEYSMACSKHGITPDRNEYSKGRSEGLKLYCTKSNGWEIGSSGLSYMNVCPSTAEPDFLVGYSAGKKLYDAETSLKSIEEEITSSREEINTLEEAIAELEELVSDDDLDDGDRKIYQRRIKENEKTIDRLDNRIDELRARRIIAQVTYTQVLGEVTAAGFEVPLFRILDIR